MARPLRIGFPRVVYHVTFRGKIKEAILIDDKDRGRFVDKGKKGKERKVEGTTVHAAYGR